MATQLQTDKDKAEEYLQKKSEAEQHVGEIEEQIKNFNKEDQLTKTKKNITTAEKELKEVGEKIKVMQHEQV